MENVVWLDLKSQPLLLLSRFSRVQLCATPQAAAHQAPLSLGFSREKYWSGLPVPFPMHACMLSRCSCVRLCATLWTAAHQAPPSTGFSRQEYWSGLPFPSPNRQVQYKHFPREIQHLLYLPISKVSHLCPTYLYPKLCEHFHTWRKYWISEMD